MEEFIKVFKSVLIIKTRKKHECWGCGKTNAKGSKLINTTYSYDGRLISVYHCLKCK